MIHAMSGNKLDSLGYLECSQADEWKWIVSEDSSWLAKHRRVDEIQTGRCNEASLVKPPPPSSLFIKLPSGDTALVSPEHCLVWHLASRSRLSVNTQANISLPPPVREIQSPMGRISTVCWESDSLHVSSSALTIHLYIDNPSAHF